MLRYQDGRWEAIPVREYKDNPRLFRGVSRRVLAAPEAAAFDVRYFEIEPGGHTTHERHEHVHVVVCLRGRGCVRFGESDQRVGYGDVVYLAPREPHQFLNPNSEPFGFLCIVDRDRDRPVLIEGQPTEADHAVAR